MEKWCQGIEVLSALFRIKFKLHKQKFWSVRKNPVFPALRSGFVVCTRHAIEKQLAPRWRHDFEESYCQLEWKLSGQSILATKKKKNRRSFWFAPLGNISPGVCLIEVKTLSVVERLCWTTLLSIRMSRSRQSKLHWCVLISIKHKFFKLACVWKLIWGQSSPMRCFAGKLTVPFSRFQRLFANELVIPRQTGSDCKLAAQKMNYTKKVLNNGRQSLWKGCPWWEQTWMFSDFSRRSLEPLVFILVSINVNTQFSGCRIYNVRRKLSWTIVETKRSQGL